MDQYSKKKNTYNYHQDRDYIFDEYNEDHITIGKGGINSNICKYEDIVYNNTCNNDNEYYTEYPSDYSDDEQNNFQLYTFSDISYIFRKFKIAHSYTTYYPFKDQDIENKYKLYYFDPDNPMIIVCPACMNKFRDKIVVMDNKIIICNQCYNNEKKINYI